MTEQSNAPVDVTAVEGSSVRELLRPRNIVRVEVKAYFELDDARIFDLNGDGLTVTVVSTN